jgi:hypothetical protein
MSKERTRHLHHDSKDWIMFEFSFWALALGTAPLVFGALWNRIAFCTIANSPAMRGNTNRFVLNAIVTGPRRSSI